MLLKHTTLVACVPGVDLACKPLDGSEPNAFENSDRWKNNAFCYVFPKQKMRYILLSVFVGWGKGANSGCDSFLVSSLVLYNKAHRFYALPRKIFDFLRLILVTSISPVLPANEHASQFTLDAISAVC